MHLISRAEVEAETDPLVCFFWDTLTPRVQDVITLNAERIFDDLRGHAWWAVQNCDRACAVWAPYFASAGIPVYVVSGVYRADIDAQRDRPFDPDIETRLADHVWLVVDGYIVDPTAIQFADSGPIETWRYVEESAA